VKVTVRLFAVARQWAGQGLVELDLPEGATVGQLRAALADRFPQLSSAAGRLMFAVGTEYAHDGQRLGAGAEVACIPPVSGG